MMKELSLLFCINFLFLFASILFNIVSSLYENNTFTNVDFYESFSTSNECFNIYHNYPTSPMFLLVRIEYELLPKNTEKIINKVRRRYQLKRINRPCRSSIAILTLGSDYNKMDLGIMFQLYYTEDFMAMSIYRFYDGFNHSPIIIETVNGEFGLHVEFSELADDKSFNYDPELPEVQSYLLSIPKNDYLICVVASNNPQIVFWPMSIPLMNDYIVTRIRMEYISEKNIKVVEEYPAYQCYENNILMETVNIIYEGFQSNIHKSLIYSKVDTLKSNFKIVRIFILNLILVNICNMNILPKNAKILFILENHKESTPFSHGTYTDLLISESNIPYLLVTNTYLNISNGVRRKRSFYLEKRSECVSSKML